MKRTLRFTLKVSYNSFTSAIVKNNISLLEFCVQPGNAMYLPETNHVHKLPSPEYFKKR